MQASKIRRKSGGYIDDDVEHAMMSDDNDQESEAEEVLEFSRKKNLILLQELSSENDEEHNQMTRILQLGLKTPSIAPFARKRKLRPLKPTNVFILRSFSCVANTCAFSNNFASQQSKTIEQFAIEIIE